MDPAKSRRGGRAAVLRENRLARTAALVASVAGLAAALAACGVVSGATGDGLRCAGVGTGCLGQADKTRTALGRHRAGVSAVAAFRAGVDARVGLVNASGGLYGRTLAYDWRDDQADQTLNLSKARELIDDDRVFGLIEAPGGAEGSIPWLSANNVPVTGLGSDPNWVGRNNMFSYYYLGEGTSTAWGDMVAQAGGTRAAVIVYGTSKSNGDFNRQFEAGLLQAGVQIVKEFQIADSITNFEAIADQLKKYRVDTIAERCCRRPPRTFFRPPAPAASI